VQKEYVNSKKGTKDEKYIRFDNQSKKLHQNSMYIVDGINLSEKAA